MKTWISDLSRWEWRGRKLALPHTIVVRLLALPVLQAARCVAFTAVLVGWGLDDAKLMWRRMRTF